MLYRAEEYSKGFITGGTLFEELGFFYLGPLDGHKLNQLIPVLENVEMQSSSVSQVFLSPLFELIRQICLLSLSK